MKHLLAAVLGIVSIIGMTGCESMRYEPYAGPAKAWPTGNTFSDHVFAVPVFRGWPERSYDVLGYIQFNNPNIDWNQGDMKSAAAKAKAMGGDALLMIPKGEATTPSLVTVRNDLGLTGTHTTAVVLKWK